MIARSDLIETIDEVLTVELEGVEGVNRLDLRDALLEAIDVEYGIVYDDGDDCYDEEEEDLELEKEEP